ncbi:hypothetical protein APS67_003261 [Streptomyces sp. AVP053U2]|nr:hypothetical protein APS67_003261 [Streptomyces sp. AVP053U2]
MPPLGQDVPGAVDQRLPKHSVVTARAHHLLGFPPSTLATGVADASPGRAGHRPGPGEKGRDDRGPDRRNGAVPWGQPRFWRFQGPVMASMMPGSWMLAYRVFPSGEKVTPVNSLNSGSCSVPMFRSLRAMG